MCVSLLPANRATDIVVLKGRGSVSLLQRTVGLGRAARFVDYMAEDGIPARRDDNGSQAHEVRYSPKEWEQLKQR